MSVSDFLVRFHINHVGLFWWLAVHTLMHRTGSEDENAEHMVPLLSCRHKRITGDQIQCIDHVFVKKIG